MFLCCVVPLSRSPATVILWCWCCFAALAFDLWSGMGSDGYQTQRRGLWIPGKERAEKVLAGAITIDGRKEWKCKFCCESIVWTRWRCRRCCGENTGRRLRRELARGPRALRCRVERRTGSLSVKMLRLQFFGRRLSGFEDKVERQDKMGQVTRSERKVVLRKIGAWKWRMRPRAKKSWTREIERLLICRR